jgi:hypothetical protein
MIRDSDLFSYVKLYELVLFTFYLLGSDFYYMYSQGSTNVI